LNKYFSPENASTILGLAAYHFSQENDDFEKSLLFLRELHGTSFDNSTTRRASLEITYPHGIDPDLSLPKPENKDPAAEQMQAKRKLSEIEEVLRPFCHRLIEECNRTGDYDILDEALENHRNIVRRFYLRQRQ
jgi:hypothetical protein